MPSALTWSPVLPGSCPESDEREEARRGECNPEDPEPLSASRWLEDALRSERAAINDSLTLQHREFMVQWMRQFENLGAKMTKRAKDVSTQCELVHVHAETRKMPSFEKLPGKTKQKFQPTPSVDSANSGSQKTQYRLLDASPRVENSPAIAVVSSVNSSESAAESGPVSPTVHVVKSLSFADQADPSSRQSPYQSSSSDCGNGNYSRQTYSVNSVYSLQSASLQYKETFESHTEIARKRFSKWAKGEPSTEERYTLIMDAGRHKLCQLISSIVRGPTFEFLFALVIIANTLVMCIKAQHRGTITAHEQGFPGYEGAVNNAWNGADTAFDVCEVLFGAAYTIEVLLKIVGLQSRFLYDAWCWFDTVIVAGWIYSMANSDQQSVDPTMFRLLRLLRLLRLARLLKTFQSFDVLHLLIGSLKASFNVLIWSVVFLGVVMIMFGLFLQMFLEVYIADASEDDRHQVFLHFGTFSRSMMSVWIVTLGNPAPIVWLLVNSVSEWFIVLFLVHHALLGFATITVVRAIFLHETLRVSQTDQEVMIREKERQISNNATHMLHLFEQADTDEDGHVTYEDFLTLIHNPKMKVFISALGLEVDDAEEAFILLDTNGDGELNIHTLMDGFTRLKGAARSIDIVQIIDMVRRVESDIKHMKNCIGCPRDPRRGSSTRASRATVESEYASHSSEAAVSE